MLAVCPLCPSKVSHLRHHLKNTHKILNLKERQILLRWARGRVKLRDLSCPVCSQKIRFIEKHIVKGHPDLTVSVVTKLTYDLKWKVTKQELRSLRESSPQMPLQTTFDIIVSLGENQDESNKAIFSEP